MEEFVQLHNHSTMSLLDGFNKPTEIVEKAKEMGHKAVALTDHGNMFGFLNFYKKAKEEGIKPIIGIEFYITDDADEKDTRQTNHLLVLAKNETGLNNLMKLISKANVDGFYYKPRIDFDWLKDYSEGLIVSSACLQGKVAQLLMDNRYEEAEKEVERYKEVFGDDFYLEIMANKIEDQVDVNEKMIDLAKYTDTKLIATNDIHYLNKEDAEAHDVMLAIGTQSLVRDRDRLSLDKDEFYFKDRETMLEDLMVNDENKQKKLEALDNTAEVAEKVSDYDIETGGLHLPNYEVPGGKTVEEHLREVCYENLFNLALEKQINVDKYKERLEHELEVINMKGFPAYFLIVADFIQWAKDQNILVGPGRGSAAGSLVSYLLGIIAVDPIEYDLLFSRFLNPERTALPDIDVDFPKDEAGRSQVMDYVNEKYGEEHVAQLCTFGTMATKAVLKDVGRALDIDYYTMNEEIAKAVPDDAGSVKEALEESETLQEYKKEYPKLFEYASKLEGKKRHQGKHASAVVITPEPVTEYTPLARVKGELVTQTEMENSEELGLLKMDFLGLKTLNIIDETIDFIHERDDLDEFGCKIPTKQNVWDIPKDNPAVYEDILQEGDTNGVFQLESYLFKQLLEKMQPEKFEHIIALLALGRPGPLDSGIVDDYIDRLHGEQRVDYPHESLEDVLEETYGLMIYQENLMKAAQVIAGFSLGKADILRRGIGKKKEKLLKKLKKEFIDGAVEKGYSEELAEEMYETIEYFAGYGFNKSHSTSYSFLAYITAYLKKFFPVEFHAAMLSWEVDKSPKDSNLYDYMSDCYQKDIDILPPDVNESGIKFTAVNGKIRQGIESINNVGNAAAREIFNKRPFDSLQDMYKKVDNQSVNKTVFENLIKAGALDGFVGEVNGLPNRNQLLKDYKQLKEEGSLKMSLFGDEMNVTTTKEDIVKMEKETMDISLTYPSKWIETKNNDTVELEGRVTDRNEIYTKNDNLMAFAELETIQESIRMVIFPTVYRENHHLFKEGVEVIVEGEKDDNSLIVNSVEYNEEGTKIEGKGA